MQPIEAKASAYIDFAVESNDTIPKLKVDYLVIIQNIGTFQEKSTHQIVCTAQQRCSLLRIFSVNMTTFGHIYRTNL